MKRIYIIIPSNRFTKLPPETVKIIEQNKIPTIFVKQNLSPFYIKHPYITEIHTTKTGAAKARNLGIKYILKQHGDIFAFTDDDCIITTSWIKTIKKFFTNPNHHLVQGQTKAYQPQKHLGQTCSCTFSTNTSKPIASLHCLADNALGFSNNLAIDKFLIKKLGGFNPQLGVGTPSLGGEDDDIFIRTLLLNESIYNGKDMLVFHNKWLNDQELNTAYRHYTFSFACTFGIHALSGNHDCQKILFKKFLNNFLNGLKYLKYFLSPKRCWELISEQNIQTIYFIRGFLYAFTLTVYKPPTPTSHHLS